MTKESATRPTAEVSEEPEEEFLVESNGVFGFAPVVEEEATVAVLETAPEAEPEPSVVLEGEPEPLEISAEDLAALDAFNFDDLEIEVGASGAPVLEQENVEEEPIIALDDVLGDMERFIPNFPELNVDASNGAETDED